MARTQKILIDELDNYMDDVTVTLVAVPGKKQKFMAAVNLDTEPDAIDDLMAETGFPRVFNGVESVLKFLGKFAEPEIGVSVVMSFDQYAVKEVATDPTKAAAKQVTHLTSRIERLAASVTKITAEVTAAQALGWNVGTAAQQAKYGEYVARKMLIEAAKTGLQTKLDALVAVGG